MRQRIFYLIFLLLPAIGFVDSLYAQTDDWTDPKYRATSLDMSGGKGDTESNPILISSEGELAFLAFAVREQANSFAGKYFKLTKNLDLKDHYWKPIGMQNVNSIYSRHFQGYFDGGGFTIYNAIIQRASGESKGLFGYITGGASIEKVFLEGINVDGDSSTGGLVGVAINSTISDCSVLGTIKNVQDFAGGIVASGEGCVITRCYTNVNFVNVKSFVGGIAGRLRNSGTQSSALSTSYSAGTVEGLYEVGGLVGTIEGSTVVINCYSMANIVANQDLSGTGGTPAGGIVGKMSTESRISNCFARNSLIKGVASDNTVNRVVGISTSFEGMLQNNMAYAKMLVSKEKGQAPVKIQDDPVNPENKPNGKGILSFCDWDGGDGWRDRDDCKDPPPPPEQSLPVKCKIRTTQEIVVTHKPPFSEMNKIILLDSLFNELKEDQQINIEKGLPNNGWRFTPIRPTEFKAMDVFYAVAYEKNKMPSYPVKIVIMPFPVNPDGFNQIFTEGKLDSVRYFPEEKYILMNDLDMSTYSEKFEPIGDKEDPFTGEFNGNNHIINNLVIEGGDCQGLFGNFEGEIYDLGLENVFISGNDYVGALVGYGNSTQSTVYNVYTTGTINATGSNVGGLAGQLASKVLRCYSTCLVKGNSNVGGLIGTTMGEVQYCYAAGPVFGTDNTGGFAGEIRSAVSAAYSSGFVSYLNQTSNGILGSFAGRLSAMAGGSLLACHFNKYASGLPDGVGSHPSNPNCTHLDLASFRGTFNTSGWYNINTSYYPQLSVFANNNNNPNISYCSALSVVPVRFYNSETAGSVKTSFFAPSEYVVGGATKKIVSLGGSTTCSILNGKVISIVPTGKTDTLKIKIDTSKLEVSGVVNKVRHICFITNQEIPNCKAERIEGAPNQNGWSNKDVVFLVSTDATDGIGGPAIFQYLDSEGEWADLEGNTHVLAEEVKELKVQFRALNGARGAGNSTTESTVNIDKTRPDIAEAKANSTKKNPMPKENVTLTVKFNDFPSVGSTVVSGMDKLKWEVKNGVSKDSITDFGGLPVVDGYLTKVFNMPQKAGCYEVFVIAEDKAGNTINNEDAGLPTIEIFVDDPDLDDYVLDGVTVDGDSAKVDPKDPLVWWYEDICVEKETAEVTIYPAEAFGIAPFTVTVTDLVFGNNPIKITLETDNVIVTFTINICREPLVASFLSLIVNGNPINIKPKVFDYSVPFVDANKEKVLVEYVLPEGESCKRPSETTFDPTSPFDFYFPLKKDLNTITLVVRSADGITNTYNISIYRGARVDPDDIINPGEGNLEDDPDSDNPIPWKDEDGNIVYDLVSKCNSKEHWITVTPVPGNLRVEFDGETREDNKYTFDIANRYTIKVNVIVDKDSTRRYIFNVLKKFNADIFHSRWASTTNDVISVIGNPNNNGGYSFTEYAWLVNGVPRNETRSYIEVMRQSDKVEAILTGVHGIGEGEIAINKIPTCPCVVEEFKPASMQVYPNMLKAGESVTIVTENIPDVDLKGANVSIVSSLGSRVANAPLTGSKTEVKMPDAPGIYLLKVSTKSITRDFKVILK